MTGNLTLMAGLFSRFLSVSLCVIFISLLSCEDPVLEIPVDEYKNKGPLNFSVSLLRVSDNYATISWGPVYDPDMDILFHTVTLGGAVISEGSSKDNLIKIENLEPDTEYTGVVKVTDKINDAVSVSFSFKTKKRFIQFSRTVNVLGQVCTKTPDKGYLIIGTTRTEESDFVLRLFKVDSLGYVEWIKLHALAGDINYSSKATVIRASDNHYLVTHYASIFKFDDKGEQVWSYHSSDFQRDRFLGGMEINNKYLVVGSIYKSGIYENVILEFDQGGNKVSEKFLPDVPGTRSELVIKTHDDKFVVMGTNVNSGLTVFKLIPNGIRFGRTPLAITITILPIVYN